MGYVGSRGGFSVSFLCATGGVGKTYSLVRELVTWTLPETNAVVYTNLPLCWGKLVDYVAEKTGRPAAEFVGRVHQIPEDVATSWVAGEGGPWRLEKSHDVSNAELWLDECHKFCPASNGKRHPAWEKWLGEARHAGWRRIIFVSQDESKVGKPIKQHADLFYELLDDASRRLPLIGMPVAHWNELKAAFTRRLVSKIWVREFRKAGGRQRLQYEESFKRTDDLFALYESYNVGHSTDAAGGSDQRAYVPQFKKRSRLGVFWWVCRQNPRALWGIIGGLVVLAGLLSGQAGYLIPWFTRVTVERMLASSMKKPGVPGDVAGSLGGTIAGSTAAGRPAAYVDPLEKLDVSALRDRVREANGRAERSALLAKAAVRSATDAVMISQYLQRERESAAVIGVLTPDSVTFLDGSTFMPGELIDYGSNKGRSVSRIDFSKRVVVLDDGRVLRVLVRVQDPAAKSTGNGVSQGVPRGGGNSPAGQGRASSGQTVDSVGQRYAVDGVSEVAGGRRGGIDSGGGGFGYQAGDNGSSGANSGGPVGGSEPAVGSPSQSGWQPLFPGATPAGGSRSYGAPGAEAFGQ